MARPLPVVCCLAVVFLAVRCQSYRITANEWDAFPTEHLNLPGAVFGTTFRCDGAVWTLLGPMYYIYIYRTISYHSILYQYCIIHHIIHHTIHHSIHHIILYHTSYHTVAIQNVSASLSWCEHAAHRSASYARALQLLALKLERIIVVS